MEEGKRIGTQSPTPNPQSLISFPINWKDDQYITRREFTSFLTLLSAALFFTSGLVGLRAWWQRGRLASPSTLRIAQLTDIPVGGVKQFHYPTPGDPCLLVRVSADRFVAYSQKCTHLSCPVIYQAAEQQFHCPCHEGRFAVEDGHPLAGPPKRPLPRITLTVSEGNIWATGVEM
jgi:Rieske Fe-S protein